LNYAAPVAADRKKEKEGEEKKRGSRYRKRGPFRLGNGKGKLNPEERRDACPFGSRGIAVQLRCNKRERRNRPLSDFEKFRGEN